MANIKFFQDLLNGKRVRRPDWNDHDYLQLEDNCLYDEEGSEATLGYDLFDMSDDYEIAEDKDDIIKDLKQEIKELKKKLRSKKK